MSAWHRGRGRWIWADSLRVLTEYVTNLPTETMTGSAVIGNYHDLWQVEKSFCKSKTNLKARPIFSPPTRPHREAHVTVVFAAPAISRHLQDLTGVSIKKIVQDLRTVRSASIEIRGQRLTLDPETLAAANDLLTSLGETGH